MKSPKVTVIATLETDLGINRLSVRMAIILLAAVRLAVADEGSRIPVAMDSGFPGGNIRVQGMTKDVVRLQPDLRDTQDSWFFGHFRVRQVAI